MRAVTETGGEAVAFKRRFVLPGVVLTVLELAVVLLPAFALFSPSQPARSVLLRAVGPVAAGALAIWGAAIVAWLSPLQSVLQARRRGERISKDLAARAYRATWRLPLRAVLLRTFLYLLVGLGLGMVLSRYADWDARGVAQLTGLFGLHALAINLVRAVWYARIGGQLRARLFPDIAPLRQFADGYFRRLVLVAIVVAGAATLGVAAFAFYVMRLPNDRYLELQLYLPITTAAATGALIALARYWTRAIDAYLSTHTASVDQPRVSGAAEAQMVYRRAQELPYRLATATVLLWVAAALGLALIVRQHVEMELDDAVLMFGVTAVISVGAALYQAMWHRETMRPLLGHLTVRHRLPMRGIRTALSLRAKLLLSFGGVVLLACGLALFWGFIQYKNLVTGFSTKQADLGLAWLRSEVQAAAAARATPPTRALAESVLIQVDTSTTAPNAVYYYQPNDLDAPMLALGGGPMGAPALPWYARAQVRLQRDGTAKVGSLGLSGEHGRLVVDWQGQRYDLGSLAVFLPTYAGRGPTIERPLKELLVFFFVLFGVCGGIAVLTVGEFVQPIRKLEQRADGMARGELAQPVTSGGESDEIGRLTYALEEMRRALGEKLRSTEEVNLDLERAVQRRTADLAKKNRELAETLEKLTRAQDQLVRSEKMASIGQLVAGIAHEINNPVNAIVNTVGPLEEALRELEESEDAEDLRDMIRVIQRGAHRTKDIVQALHNYSRTDDESVVPVDLNRSLDDSLELLRHLLKQSVRVERNYGDIQRIRGHAGQLNQVFMNLLTNAAQAVSHAEGGTIRVSTREADGGVVIEVADDGPGIRADVLPRIFDPFFTTKEVGEGTGLGLSIVHGIVERHGGSIEVDSEVGNGTTFRVTLPRA